eukprot:COSAG04_NODE_1800_length_5550_cov_7.059657_2_plen_99_part_00
MAAQAMRANLPVHLIKCVHNSSSLLLLPRPLARLQLADEALDGVRRAGAGMDTKPILPKRPNKKNPYVKKPPRPAKDLHPLDAKALKQAAAEYDADSD